MDSIFQIIDYTIFFFTSIFIIYAIFLILTKSTPNMSLYKYLLLNQLLWDYAIDTGLVLWQPIVIIKFPIFLLYSDGILSYIGPNMLYVMIALGAVGMIGLVHALYACMLYRVVSIFFESRFYVIIKVPRQFWRVFMATFILGMVFFEWPFLVLLFYPKNFDKIFKHAKEFITNLDNLLTLEPSLNGCDFDTCFTPLAIIFVTETIPTAAMLITIAIIGFLYLRRSMKLRVQYISDDTMRQSQMLMKALIIHFGIIALFLGIPAIYFYSLFYFQFGDPTLFLKIAATFFSTHTIVDIIAMIYFIRPYNNPWTQSKIMIPNELLLDVLRALDRNEIEKCQLIDRRFKCLVSYSENLPRRLVNYLRIGNYYEEGNNAQQHLFFHLKHNDAFVDMSPEYMDNEGEEFRQTLGRLSQCAFEELIITHLSLPTIDRLNFVVKEFGHKIPIRKLVIEEKDDGYLLHEILPTILEKYCEPKVIRTPISSHELDDMMEYPMILRFPDYVEKIYLDISFNLFAIFVDDIPDAIGRFMRFFRDCRLEGADRYTIFVGNVYRVENLRTFGEEFIKNFLEASNLKHMIKNYEFEGEDQYEFWNAFYRALLEHEPERYFDGAYDHEFGTETFILKRSDGWKMEVEHEFMLDMHKDTIIRILKP